MSKKNNVIEINGRRYDANSGTLLEGQQSGQNVDGVIRSSASGSQAKSKGIFRKAAAPKGRQPEAAKTLMRSVVHKPAPALKREIHVQAAEHALSTVAVVATTPVAAHRSAQLAHRAKQIDKNQLITHFTDNSAAAPVPTTPSLAQPPVPPPGVTEPERPSAPPSHQPSLDIFERALADATAHELPKLPRQRSRRKAVISALLCVVIVGIAGFLVTQNTSDFRLYLASSKAGFQASLPAYEPSGFGLQGLSANSASVTATYTSHQQTYTLAEKSSDWDSATLFDTFVSQVAPQNYQTVQSDGHTVYLYGEGNATWVSGGILYQIQSHGVLTSKQLIALANSL